MRFISFVSQAPSFGLINEHGGIVDLRQRFAGQAGTLREWLATEGWNSPRLAELSMLPSDYHLHEVTLLPVIPNPAHIWCLASNYQDHINEVRETGIQLARPEYPAVFMRYPDTLVAHEAPITLPKVSQSLDWEGELAVIIAKGGRYIAEADALSHVAGYACFNDASVRDWQFHTRQIAPGKNFSGTGALGPWMVTADEIPDPQNLAITTRVNGDVMQQGRTADMIFSISAFIAYVSSLLPLQPGDILATGTPSGVGFSRTPQVFLKPGDLCEVEIEKVGTLSNRVESE